MSWYLIVKTLHILSSTVLLGTGIGIAFFMLRASFSENNVEKLYAARNTVLADMIFTLPAVIIQPATGAWLVWYAGFDWTARWLVITYLLYVIAGLCWLLVVWIQIQLKQMLIKSTADITPLPARYNRLFWLWFALGWPAFVSLVTIFFLMVMKPS